MSSRNILGNRFVPRQEERGIRYRSPNYTAPGLQSPTFAQRTAALEDQNRSLNNAVSELLDRIMRLEAILGARGQINHCPPCRDRSICGDKCNKGCYDSSTTCCTSTSSSDCSTSETDKIVKKVLKALKCKKTTDCDESNTSDTCSEYLEKYGCYDAPSIKWIDRKCD